MKQERIELVLLRSAGGPSRRYRLENLALLNPSPGTVYFTTYRQRWVHPALRPAGADGPAPDLVGCRVGIHFFEYSANMLLPVRLAQVADAAWSAGSLRLGLALEGWLDPNRPAAADLIPRLEDGAEGEAPLPPDGRGPHAFVFPRPPGWPPLADAGDEGDGAGPWQAAATALAAPPASPYRDCLFLAGWPPAEHGTGWKVALLAGPDAPAAASTARLVALQGGRRVGATETSLCPGQKTGLALDTSAARRGGDPLKVELHLVGGGACATASAWTLPAPLEARAEAENRPDPLEAVLAHLQPENDAQRDLIRQVVRGVRRHARVETWLVDLLLGWGLAAEAAALLTDYPDLADRVSNLELAAWYSRLRHERLAEGLSSELVRRIRAGEPTYLSEEFLDDLKVADDKRFWSVLAGLGFPLAREGDGPLLDHPFGAALFTSDRWDEWLARLAERFPAAPSHWKSWILSVLRDSSAWKVAAGDWEIKALRQGEAWADAARGLRAVPLAESPALLHRLGPASSPAACAWYYEVRHELAKSDPDLWAEVIYALRRLAPAEEAPIWDLELAEAALATGDALLLARCHHRLASDGGSAELREQLAAALRETGPVDACRTLTRLRERLRGRRVVLLGAQYTPAWVKDVEEETGIEVVVKTAEKCAAYNAGDIPDGACFCAILRWAGHDALRVSRERLGPERVRFLNGTGRRAFVAALSDMLDNVRE